MRRRPFNRLVFLLIALLALVMLAGRARAKVKEYVERSVTIVVVPVPEPTRVLLLGGGAAVMFLNRRRHIA